MRMKWHRSLAGAVWPIVGLLLGSCATPAAPEGPAVYDLEYKALATCFFQEMQKITRNPIQFADLQAIKTIQVASILATPYPTPVKAWEVRIKPVAVARSEVSINLLDTNIFKGQDLAKLRGVLAGCAQKSPNS